MADLHPEKCFCAGTGFLRVEDVHNNTRYMEVSCPGPNGIKQRPLQEPKNRLARILPDNEWVLSERDKAGRSVQINHLTDGSPVATIRMWAWEIESQDWIVLHRETCTLSAEETARLKNILNEHLRMWAGPARSR